MEKELDTILKKIKNWKAAGLDKIPTEALKTRKFDDILLQLCNGVYKQNTIDKWTKGCNLPFLKKSDLGITENYKGVILTAKVYNALFLHHMQPEIKKIRKNQNNFWKNPSTTSQIMTINFIIEEVQAKNLVATLMFEDFSFTNTTCMKSSQRNC